MLIVKFPVPNCIDAESFIVPNTFAYGKVSLPPFNELYVGLPVNIALFPLPLKSVHVVPVPGYDDALPASKFNVKPDVTRNAVVSPV